MSSLIALTPFYVRHYFRSWPNNLGFRLFVIFFIGLVAANALCITRQFSDHAQSSDALPQRSLEHTIMTSLALLDRLSSDKRAEWLPRLNQKNYRFLLNEGELGPHPEGKPSSEAADAIIRAASTLFALTINALPGSGEHLQVHLQLADGSPLTIDVTPAATPSVAPFAHWLSLTWVGQLLLLLCCSWFAVRVAIRPLTQLTEAANALNLDKKVPRLVEQGPTEVINAATSFNAMRDRISAYLEERVQILASIAHDLKTPITRMKLRSELMDNSAEKDKLCRDLCEMEHLVQEGLAYAKSMNAATEPSCRLDPDAFLDSLVCDYQDTGKQVELIGQLSTPLVTQPRAMRRVLSNLIDNALKFAGAAEVRVQRELNQQISIFVLDRGPGIPQEEMTAVLQPFYRQECSRSSAIGGAGLGLAIAHRLVQALGGTLTLSNREGGGLCAHIQLSEQQQ